MRKVRNLLLALIMSALLVCGAVCVAACDTKTSDKTSSGPDTSIESPVKPGEDDKKPEDKRQIGVMFADVPAENGKITVDYKNALSGIGFYDSKSQNLDYIDDNLTTLTVNGTSVNASDYVYNSGLLEFDAEYLKSLTLGTEYTVKATFGDLSIEFKLVMADSLTPAYSYADTLIKEVYIMGSEVTFPTATKSPASIQNTKVEYALCDSEGTEVTIDANSFTANEVGRYTYTATFYKNGSIAETKSRSFSVIDVATANLADEHIASVLGGTYNTTEQAATFIGKSKLTQIEIADTYKFVRIEYKGSGTVTFDKKQDDAFVPDTTTLDSTESYKTVWINTDYINSLEISTTDTLYIKSFTVSQTSAFNAYDIENVNFASKEFLGYWQYGGSYVPIFDDIKNATVFAQNGNSYVYALRKQLIKTAYELGYKYLVISYIGGGTTRVFNDTTGDWGGYSKDLALAESEPKRIAYNLETAAAKAEIDATSGFSFIANDKDIELYEFKFYQKDVVAIAAGIYNNANLAEADLQDVWVGGAEYDNQTLAMNFAAGKTYTFGEEALEKAQTKGGKVALGIIAKGKGKVSLVAADDSQTSVEVDFDSTDYTAGLALFGELTFDAASYIAVVTDSGSLTVQSMWFTDNTSSEVNSYLVSNLASAKLISKWEDWGSATHEYDTTEEAFHFTASNTAPHFPAAGILEAQRAGYDAIRFVAKGRFAIYMYTGGEWNRMGSGFNIWDNYDTDDYVTGLIVFDGLEFTANTGIAMWNCGENANSYIKTMEFVRRKDIIASASTDIKNIFGNGANLADKAYESYWKTTEKATTEYYSVGEGTDNAFKTTFESGRNAFALELNIDDWLMYVIAFGKTKFVWTYDSEQTSVAGNIRIKYYEHSGDTPDGKNGKSINGQGRKVDDSRVTDYTFSNVGSTARISLENNNKDASETYALTDFHFE